MSKGKLADSVGGDKKPSTAQLRRKRQNLIGRLVRVFIKLAVVAGSAVLICLFLACPYAVHGNRMFPKLRDGDCAVVLKVGGFERGDVISYKKDGVRYFSRVIAMSGDSVSIGEDGFRINGCVPSEEIFYVTEADELIDYELGPDEVFVLNDYRSNQSDSREFGKLKLNEIEGKVVFLFRWRGL